MCTCVCVLCTWVSGCDYVRGWVHAYVQVGAHVSVCGRSKVGTYECMINTSCTHVSAKAVRYPFVSRFLTQDAFLYFNEYNLRRPLHQFSLACSEVRCFILNKTAP